MNRGCGFLRLLGWSMNLAEMVSENSVMAEPLVERLSEL